MREVLMRASVAMMIGMLVFATGSHAQDAFQPAPIAVGGDTGANSEPNAPAVAEPPLRWRWREQYQPRPGAPVAPRSPSLPEDGTPVTRERTVTTPHGTMTQTWEGSRSDDGYSLRREQTWTAPDGTPIRSHETEITGAGPNNYQREKTITLRDGRTVEHSYSRSWDGQTLQTERSFTGPNGQTWTREQSRTRGPDETPAAAAPNPDPPASRPSGFTLGSSRAGGTADRQGPIQRAPRAPETTPSLARRIRPEWSSQDRPRHVLRPNPPRGQGRR